MRPLESSVYSEMLADGLDEGESLDCKRRSGRWLSSRNERGSE